MLHKVGGDRVGIGHRRPPDRRDGGAGSLQGPGTSPGRQRRSARRVGRHEGGAGSRLEGQCGPPGSDAVQAGRVVMLGGGRGDAGQLRQGKAGGRDGAMTLRYVQIYGSSPTRDEVGAENTTRGKHGRDGYASQRICTR